MYKFCTSSSCDQGMSISCILLINNHVCFGIECSLDFYAKTVISYGVISTPELTDWQPLTANDSYLVAASDGVFEKLSLHDVCDLLWEVHGHGPGRLQFSSSCSYSLADCIVNTAFEMGSMDNVAAVVVPLVSTGFSENLLKERSIGEQDKSSPVLGLPKSTYDFSGTSLCFKLSDLSAAEFQFL